MQPFLEIFAGFAQFTLVKLAKRLVILNERHPVQITRFMMQLQRLFAASLPVCN